ncbi:uncharacterized protein LOC119584774 [Penaeus monodon]|uniref:uncharacterized protein LOC119584774 n=1 Tax=Penaeus monodon TaxID=6687 RepID=UPI0018A793B7|nr:uncharacterized protein LOC119584774 [Penaeus monodon]
MEQQGLTPHNCIPPLYKLDGNVATSNHDKAELLASFFSQKMRVCEPDRTLPHLPSLTNQRLNTMVIGIVLKVMKSFFDIRHLFSSKQFGFGSIRSVCALLPQLVSNWNKSLDAGKKNYIIALDIAGSFDRVWYKGTISKLKGFGIDGDLLKLNEYYLRGRTLQLVVNGSGGLLLWDVCFIEILHVIPESHAYTDD